MKKMLITGATGFIGKMLVPKLAKNNKLVCFVRRSSNTACLKMKNVSFAYGDIMDKESINSAVKDFDVVIHLAASHTSGSEERNINGSANIISICRKRNVKKFIFISSMAVKRKSLDDYGRAKLKIENMLKKSGLNYVIIRPSIIYSKDNLSLIGKSLTSLPFFIPIIGNGRYKLNPVFIEDVVKVISLVSEKESIKNKEYDVAGAKSMSFNNIVDLCRREFSMQKIKLHIPIFLCVLVFRLVPLVSIESVKGINESTNADISALEEDLNVMPISFEEGIKNVTLH